MTTPTPDKLAIPEAAVEAAARAIYEWRETAGDQIPMGTLWRELPEESRESYREDGLAAIHGFIPHIPDRGYAEGIEAAAEKARLWITATDDPCMGRCLELAATIRTLAAPAPADNGAGQWPQAREDIAVMPHDDSIGSVEFRTATEIQTERLAAKDNITTIVLENGWTAIDGLIVQNDDGSRWLSLDEPLSLAKEFVQEAVEEAIARGKATPVEAAEPSEAEIEDARQEGYNEGYEGGKSDWRGVKAQLWNAMQHWLTLRHGLDDMTGEGYTVSNLLDGLSEVEAENKRLSDFVGRQTALAEAAETTIAFLVEKFVPPYEPWMDDFKDSDAITSFYRGGSTYGDLRHALAARRVRPSPVERSLDERMEKGVSDFAAVLNAGQGFVEGVKAAAKQVAKRRDGYVEEHGSYDPDTGVTEFPGTGEEYVGELDEIEEEILALLPAIQSQRKG